MKSKITLIQILFLCVFIICGFLAFTYFADEHSSEKTMDQIRDMVNDEEPETEYEFYEPNGMLSRYYALYEQNPDMVGWIKLDGTCIDYPVMQRDDTNAYYLRRDFYGDASSSGIPFADYQCSRDCSDTNVIIYAHNMRNGTMFHDLLLYENQDFWENNPSISFDTMYERRSYEIFAVFRSDVGAEDEFKYYEFIDAQTNEDFNAFVDTAIARSFYDTGVRPEYGDRLLTLSTCSYNSNDERFVVIAKLQK